MRTLLFITLIVILSASADAQNLFVMEDRAGILSPGLEDQLRSRLESRDIEYTTTVDYQRRCDYFYGTLLMADQETAVKIEDCEGKELGFKKLGKNFLNGTEEERSILLSFAIRDIIENPGEYISGQTAGEDIQPEESSTPSFSDTLLENHHTSRYFFSPSAYNIKQGELYYNTLYFFLHDIQYGISDHFSLGMGTTLIGIPFYLTPKLSIPLSDRSTIALGDMLILGTWGSRFVGNLAYLVYTYGSDDNNISLGGGLFTTNENDLTRNNQSFVVNLSGMAKVSDFVYLVTENYGFQVNATQTAYYDSFDEITKEWEYFEEDFSQRQTIIYGLSGLRFINKTNDVVSWQFGLTYIINFREDIPSKYTTDPWYNSAVSGGSRFIAVPTVSYTRKFGKKY